MGVKAFRSLLAIGVCLAALPAQAETLKEALAKAYESNPSLEAARANQRATDENVPIERADSLPSLSASGGINEFPYDSSDIASAQRQATASVTLGVPIYAGGGVKNGIRAAETRVVAGQADLRGTESQVFSQVVAAYMDVVQNEALVGLAANNVEVLNVNLQATSDRFEIGDLTRTDVAQSQSRLSLARGDLEASRANLIRARENYIALVGEAPTDLQPPPPLPGLPATPDDAVDVALQNNPDLLAAMERAKAAGFDVRVASASRLPTLSVNAGADYSNFLNSLPEALQGLTPNSNSGASVGVRATVPLYQGGRPAALRRQAQARESVALENIVATERDLIAQVRAAYSSWRAANEIIASSQTAVEAAALSLEGVRAENTVGNRTILDILDAQQEHLRAQVQLVTARRNAYVAGFTLLAAMGRAEARDLGLDELGTLYDPTVNYERVRRKAWDWSDDPAPVTQSTRTVDIPAQDAEIPPQQAVE
ncbi:TolC family outer membrane protein [Croceibacterium sp. LX-88]|jgi:outer membrane protein|uniref:TolC family outer membrane protein n=1 Tax=Croceibacterium selenioxidans TaxID=2838833 RepID=A0ABS5W6B2_9SPHN|nr:TolC family outer membrane protein [Croceibacterium selenioxidans]MBT2135287.1 TolC family outer membrane protein [Croceibacterium selenioxidans]